MGYTEYTHTAPASMMCELQRIATVVDAVALDDVAVAVAACASLMKCTLD